MTALRVLREAAELALKALCEEQAAYEDPLYHVDEAIKALRAALAHPPESDALSRLASLADTVAAAVRNTCSMPHPNIGLDTDLAPYIWSLSFEANAQKKRADALAHLAEGAQTLPAAHEEDAVRGRCAGWLRLFKFKHGRDPFPQEVWDAALVLGYQTAAALHTPPKGPPPKPGSAYDLSDKGFVAINKARKEGKLL